MKSKVSLSLLLIRIIPGLVFLAEGIQKFLFDDTLGTGRFLKIGFGNPAFWAHFTACFEITCGALLIAGLLTRLAAIPPLIIMAVAFVTTKVPILIEKGIWPMLHEYRTDFAMTLTLIVVIMNGAGSWSLDKVFRRQNAGV
jgi:putative oxidoreductase